MFKIYFSRSPNNSANVFSLFNLLSFSRLLLLLSILSVIISCLDFYFIQFFLRKFDTEKILHKKTNFHFLYSWINNFWLNFRSLVYFNNFFP